MSPSSSYQYESSISVCSESLLEDCQDISASLESILVIDDMTSDWLDSVEECIPIPISAPVPVFNPALYPGFRKAHTYHFTVCSVVHVRTFGPLHRCYL